MSLQKGLAILLDLQDFFVFPQFSQCIDILILQLNKKRPNRCKRLSQTGNIGEIYHPYNKYERFTFILNICIAYYQMSYLPIWSVRHFCFD